MSPIRMGRASLAPISSDELASRATSLSLALHTGGDELEPEAAGRARLVIDKVEQRTSIVGDHTVVALAGATGSGKSSLFNAILQADVATIGARRPTTSKPTAAVFGPADASPLLDWLRVDARHLVAAPAVDAAADPAGEATADPADDPAGEATADAADDPVDEATAIQPERDWPVGSLDGLVLLDLPDFDSREMAHRREAERILELVDVFVWVTDPQKYADARLHDDFVRLRSRHEAVTLVVLNQIDRLAPRERTACVADLHRLLADDGVAGATVLTTSARTGEGVPGLRQRLANAVAGQAASRQRLAADIVTVARQLRRDVGDDEVAVTRLPRAQLDEALARAAGVPIVLDAVARDYRREAFANTGWLFARWTRRLTADPLRRLGLDRDGRTSISLDIEPADVRAVLGRSSVPAPSVSTASAVDVATRAVVRAAAVGLPVRWEQALEDAVPGDHGSLADALDQALLHTSLRSRRPVWWPLVNLLQWLLGLAAIAGLLWLGVLWVLSLLALPEPRTPAVGILPVPSLLLVGGLLLGLGLGALARWWARIGARRRRAKVDRRLRASIASVSDERVIEPVAAVLDRHRNTRRYLDEAAS